MKRKTLSLLLSLLLLVSVSQAQQLAFPGAEGYGKFTTGGRGGKVHEVTNLNSSGPGSFAEAINASGPRTVVFRVSGTITGNYNIKNGDITIAGQTAPGDGICIKGRLAVSADNVIIRYIRVRNDPAANPDSDTFGGRFQKNIIFDHISASWSTDEVFSLYASENVTIQWCMITQACPKDGGDSHRFGGVWGNYNSTYHHNLFAHNESRNPRFAGAIKLNDYRNNVVYNWAHNSCYGGEAEGGETFINMVANYYKPGPATQAGEVSYRICSPSYEHAGKKGYGKWYVADNYVVGNAAVTADNWNGGVQPSAPGGMAALSSLKLNEPAPFMAINQQSAQDAYKTVLDKVGCYIPNSLPRDKVDKDIIEDVRNGTAKYGRNGIINSPADVGGWPVLKSKPAPKDTDHDGIPDVWEKKNGLNPKDPFDGNKVAADGYTMLEKYINSL